MRKYLVTVVFGPGAKVEGAVQEIKQFIDSSGGTVESEEDLSSKKLAYVISGNTEGSFYEFIISGPASLPAKLSETLRINDQVIRFLVTHYNEEKTKLDPVAETRSK